MHSKDEFNRQINNIRNVLKSAHKDAMQGMITKDFVNRYIDKIFVTRENENTMRLVIKIFTGETCERFFRKLEIRTVHTFKNICIVKKIDNSAIKNIFYTKYTNLLYLNRKKDPSIGGILF